MEPTLTDWLNSALLFTVIIGLYLAYRELREMSNQRWISIYSEYTKRYSDIIKEFPENINEPSFSLDSLPSKKRAQTMRSMRLYFDLCYEEYSLYNTYKKIDEVIWKDWKEGIEAALSKKSFQEAWKVIEKDTLFSQTGDFNEFINELITKSHKVPSK